MTDPAPTKVRHPPGSIDAVNQERARRGQPLLVPEELAERNRLLALYRDGTPEERAAAWRELQRADRPLDAPRVATPDQVARRRAAIARMLGPRRAPAPQPSPALADAVAGRAPDPLRPDDGRPRAEDGWQREPVRLGEFPF
jgi:hypothetical protein